MTTDAPVRFRPEVTITMPEPASLLAAPTPLVASGMTTLPTHHPDELIASADINLLQSVASGNQTAVVGPVMRSARAYATVTAAIAASSDGDIVDFPPGVYVTDPLVVTGKTVHFRARRGATIKLRDGANASLLTISGPAAAGSSVHGGVWDGNRAGQTGVTNPNQDAVILIDGADDCTVERARIQGGYVHGVFAYHCVGTRVLHNDIDDCDGLSTSTFPLGSIGAVRATDGFLAQGNRITRPGGCGIKVTAYDGADPSAVTDAPRVLYNRVDYTGVTPANDNCLGIEVWGAVPCSEVVGNTVIGPASGTHRIYGISVAIGHGSVVGLNTCRRMLGLGIEVAGSDGCAVGTNTVRDANIGISVATTVGTVSRGTVTGNTVRDTHSLGMQIYGAAATAWTITGNTFTDCTGDALLLNQGGRGTVIAGNVFVLLSNAAALFAIHLYQATGVTIGPNSVMTDPAGGLAGGLMAVNLQNAADINIQGGVWDGRSAAGGVGCNYNLACEAVTGLHVQGVTMLGAAVAPVAMGADSTGVVIEDCPGYSYRSAPPTGGYHPVGERMHHTAPAAGGNEGWICTTAGTPGVWKAYGTIAA